MASFCKTCSIAMWGQDDGDFADLMPKEKYSSTVGALALCECCGPVVEDIDGLRMSDFDHRCDCASFEPVEQPLRPYP